MVVVESEQGLSHRDDRSSEGTINDGGSTSSVLGAHGVVRENESKGYRKHLT